MINPAELSDEQLVAIIRTQDQELYSEIIRRYKTKLSHYLRKFIYDTDELEDVLQIVFIKAYRNLFGFNTHQKFSSWIYRISHNEAINHLKKYVGKAVPLEEVEYKIMDEKIDLYEELDKNLLRKEMSGHLSQLKLKYREPLILFYFEQKSYEEISDILRLPKNTVGTLIARGKELMKKNLNQNNKFNKNL